MNCEFCGSTKKLKIRHNNRVICSHCWEDRVTQCFASTDGKKRCTNNTIFENKLCYYHQDRQAEKWYKCPICSWYVIVGYFCWRCKEYGKPHKRFEWWKQ